MEKRTMLNIKTINGNYVIPFLDLKKLDGFTAGFCNEEEMIGALNRVLDLSIEMEDIININISSDRYKEKNNSSLSCIKYRGDNLVVRDMDETKKNNLSKNESYNDEFIQYLIELASRGEEYLDKAMEELSKVDLEDISRTLEKGGLGIFDGLGEGRDVGFDEDAYVLVEYTGMSIEELKSIQPSMEMEQLFISGFGR